MKIHAFALGLASLLASAVSDVAAPTADVNEDAPFTPDPKNHHHDEEAQGMPFTPDADNYGHDEDAASMPDADNYGHDWFCCYWSPTSDMCGDRRQGDLDGCLSPADSGYEWCVASRARCEGCGGTFCDADNYGHDEDAHSTPDADSDVPTSDGHHHGGDEGDHVDESDGHYDEGAHSTPDADNYGHDEDAASMPDADNYGHDEEADSTPYADIYGHAEDAHFGDEGDHVDESDGHYDEDAHFTPDADNYGHDEEADEDKATSSSESTATVAWAVPVAIGGVLVLGGGAFLLARKHKTAATQRPEMGALDSQA